MTPTATLALTPSQRFDQNSLADIIRQQAAIEPKRSTLSVALRRLANGGPNGFANPAASPFARASVCVAVACAEVQRWTRSALSAGSGAAFDLDLVPGGARSCRNDYAAMH